MRRAGVPAATSRQEASSFARVTAENVSLTRFSVPRIDGIYMGSLVFRKFGPLLL